MVEVYNHQQKVVFEPSLLKRWEEAAAKSLPLVLANKANGGGVLASLETVEVSIIDDVTIDQIHRDFMDIAGATDVITFAHGEIVVSVETAQSYAEMYGHSYEKELMLYIIHGLLHLAGHEDSDEKEREAMEQVQTKILAQVWE